MLKFIIIIVLVFNSALTSYSQSKESQKLDERKKISELFRENLNREKFTDTNQLVLFAVKVIVDNSEDEVVVKEIKLSDSLSAFHFKSYDFLKEINFNLLTKRREKALTFIFPVLIAIVRPKDPIEKGVTLSAYQAILNYLFIKDYFNEPIENYIFTPGYTMLAVQEELN